MAAARVDYGDIHRCQTRADPLIERCDDQIPVGLVRDYCARNVDRIECAKGLLGLAAGSWVAESRAFRATMGASISSGERPHRTVP